MTQTSIEPLDISTYVQYGVTFAWIGLSFVFYLAMKSKKLISVEPGSVSDAVLPLKTKDFNMELPSLLPPGLPELIKMEDSPKQEKADYDPGRMTINPWLNFLRHFRRSNESIRRQTELFQRASKVWHTMSDSQKEPFRLQAEHMRKLRDW